MAVNVSETDVNVILLNQLREGLLMTQNNLNDFFITISAILVFGNYII